MNGAAQLWTAALRAALDALRDSVQLEHGAEFFVTSLTDAKRLRMLAILTSCTNQALMRSSC